MDLLVGQVVDGQQGSGRSRQFPAGVPVSPVKECRRSLGVVGMDHVHRPVQQPGQQQGRLPVQGRSGQPVGKGLSLFVEVDPRAAKERLALNQVDLDR